MIPATDLLPPDLQASDYERLCLQKLEAEEVAALGRFGRNRTFADGEHLFRTGDRDLSVFIVLRGEAQVYFTRGGKEHELVVVGEGNFIGDVSMLTRMAAVASVRARGQLEVVEIPEKEFRRALSDYAAIAAKIIRAFVLRRQWLESMDDFCSRRSARRNRQIRLGGYCCVVRCQLDLAAVLKYFFRSVYFVGSSVHDHQKFAGL
jgi:CRP-like cAMP-binding protein